MDWTTAIFVDFGATFFPWVATFVLALLGKYVFSKIENETWRGIATRATEEAFGAVQEVQQTYVSSIKDGRKGDGKLSEGEKQTARDLAWKSARENLGPKGFARLARVVGGTVNAESYLSGKIESAVHQLKTVEKSVAAVAEAPKK